ncbi:MAG: hypothetical protein HY370_06725 [Proteobacteria bacterium]|nr:hypothetical protein [Pseudomonadota bacterium]
MAYKQADIAQLKRSAVFNADANQYLNRDAAPLAALSAAELVDRRFSQKLRLGKNPDSHQSYREMPDYKLWQGILDGNVKDAEQAVFDGADVKGDGHASIVMSATLGDVRMTAMLRDYGADILAQDALPLRAAAENGQGAFLKNILEGKNNADILKKLDEPRSKSEGWGTLRNMLTKLAEKNGNDDLAGYLKDVGKKDGSVLQQSEADMQDVLRSARNDGSGATERLRGMLGAWPDNKIIGKDSLQLAVRFHENAPQMLGLLLDKNAGTPEDRKKMLQEAINRGQGEVASDFIAHGVDMKGLSLRALDANPKWKEERNQCVSGLLRQYAESGASADAAACRADATDLQRTSAIRLNPVGPG